MTRLTLPLALILFSAAAGADDHEAGFRPLFNGKDLTGWVAVNTAPSTWTVEDEMLICSGKPIGELRTDRMYQNFIFEVEWRHLVLKGNAGIFVWADDITARGQPFHRGIEVQVLENAAGSSAFHTSQGDIFPIHGATMTPINGRGGSRAFPSEDRANPSPQWNHYRITCRDGDISLAVNGKVVTRGTDCSPRKGYICLESEGGVVHYRNLRIKELPDTPIADEHVAIADRGYRCLYTGVDLSGWSVAEGTAGGWKSNDWKLIYEGDTANSQPAISTTESFGDFGFVLDVRLREASGNPRIRLRGSDRAEIVLGPENDLLGPHLAKSGSWNRLEGELDGDRLTLSLNGQRVIAGRQLTGIPDEGPLTIIAEGPVELANPFVRSLTN